MSLLFVTRMAGMASQLFQRLRSIPLIENWNGKTTPPLEGLGLLETNIERKRECLCDNANTDASLPTSKLESIPVHRWLGANVRARRTILFCSEIYDNHSRLRSTLGDESPDTYIIQHIKARKVD